MKMLSSKRPSWTPPREIRFPDSGHGSRGHCRSIAEPPRYPRHAGHVRTHEADAQKPRGLAERPIELPRRFSFFSRPECRRSYRGPAVRASRQTMSRSDRLEPCTLWNGFNAADGGRADLQNDRQPARRADPARSQQAREHSQASRGDIDGGLTLSEATDL